eukprot:CAMPEP_0174984356 /NCGR_PEP_ID=MMETSP0004_2-20121128/17676_1 /TAXON_ID=420556 /ORGANISM="Ochromonas sp., Strain CCMP1393" /LENGTH=134 /DNA_ID=CAMNT_0016236755 /DNA_START=478 /DNA_END=882 /DNA_ORIENTATION=+
MNADQFDNEIRNNVGGGEGMDMRDIVQLEDILMAEEEGEGGVQPAPVGPPRQHQLNHRDRNPRAELPVEEREGGEVEQEQRQQQRPLIHRRGKKARRNYEERVLRRAQQQQQRHNFQLEVGDAVEDDERDRFVF